MALLPVAELRTDECGICYEAYKGSAGGQVPKLLWCCHSVCLSCLGRLVCQNGAFSSVVCPFCRMVTLVPEGGLQALRDDEALLRQVVPGRPQTQEAPGDGHGRDSPRVSDQTPGNDSAPALDFNYGSPVFTISGFVPAYAATAIRPGAGMWGRFRLQEVRNAVLVELPHTVSGRDSETPKSVENLRLCFAVTIILLIVSVFFALVFLK